LIALAGGPLCAAPGGGGHGGGGGGGGHYGGGAGGGGAVHAYSSAGSSRYSSGSSAAIRATPSYSGYGATHAYVGSPAGSWSHNNGWWNNNWGRYPYHNYYGYGPWWGLGFYGYWDPWWYTGLYPDAYCPYYAYDASMYGYPATAALYPPDSAAQPYATYSVAPTTAMLDPSAAPQPNEPVGSEASSLPTRHWMPFTREITARPCGWPPTRRSTCRAAPGYTS
jgi:hypothetical protein